MIRNSIVIASAKGGAGKTSVTANMTSLIAASGWRVLAVDLDGQANLSQDLGALAHPQYDDGKGLLVAALSDQLPTIIEITEYLSVVPAGRATFQLANTLTADPSDENLLGIERALTRVSDQFDLILIDTPPTGANRIVDAGLAAAGHLLIPTPPDPGSLNGLHLTASAFSEVKQRLNPGLSLLGVVLFRIPAAATAIRAEARAELEASLGTAIPVYNAVIRDALRAAVDQRRFALSAHDYHAAATSATPWYKRRTDPDPDPDPDPEVTASANDAPATFSQAATGLAEDYRQLVREVIADYLAGVDRSADRQASP